MLLSTPDTVVMRNAPALDEILYSLDPDEVAWLLAETHIETESALKSHILDVQVKAYKISRLPAYQKVLKLGRERQNVILLDLGCCFGNDTRKVVSDGYPAKGVVASDIHKAFWDLGHELFRSTPEKFPVPFVWEDVFDPSILEAVTPFNVPPNTPMPPLSSLTSLNPLRGHVEVIHASYFFHLFGEERQLQLARALAGLLSPESGSIILGSQVGYPSKVVKQTSDGANLYCHSPESWKELWGEAFKQGEVEVFLRPVNWNDTFMLDWSVTRA